MNLSLLKTFINNKSYFSKKLFINKFSSLLSNKYTRARTRHLALYVFVNYFTTITCIALSFTPPVFGVCFLI